ncbi:uncharacterized protein MONOS_622 [Monocercomonoides exilis]|uniref:uncharacterized protein n=1 Tax=Monocercomonoides exilis TaxID=2049356 RepID=UPI003559831F|nr:hypothetical protein MONOS_622 [Monocercomonoides exilis]|eukprot:MONOS_622.1-p1 / transcript=MONOS_622.1 / gene=MONOS_622 / organism=Monocercomonoides_exilis_PA203 / gene_product=unspecified product / transcript_product=unspecified product / location=Mono_scaffold00010:42577-48274(+) / protein_length=1590 / sequence_SO=supercontig / SO=protein_coding / is_pseudo=false
MLVVLLLRLLTSSYSYGVDGYEKPRFPYSIAKISTNSLRNLGVGKFWNVKVYSTFGEIHMSKLFFRFSYYLWSFSFGFWVGHLHSASNVAVVKVQILVLSVCGIVETFFIQSSLDEVYQGIASYDEGMKGIIEVSLLVNNVPLAILDHTRAFATSILNETSAQTMVKDMTLTTIQPLLRLSSAYFASVPESDIDFLASVTFDVVEDLDSTSQQRSFHLENPTPSGFTNSDSHLLSLISSLNTLSSSTAANASLLVEQTVQLADELSWIASNLTLRMNTLNENADELIDNFIDIPSVKQTLNAITLSVSEAATVISNCRSKLMSNAKFLSVAVQHATQLASKMIHIIDAKMHCAGIGERSGLIALQEKKEICRRVFGSQSQFKSNRANVLRNGNSFDSQKGSNLNDTGLFMLQNFENFSSSNSAIFSNYPIQNYSTQLHPQMQKTYDTGTPVQNAPSKMKLLDISEYLLDTIPEMSTELSLSDVFDLQREISSSLTDPGTQPTHMTANLDSIFNLLSSEIKSDLNAQIYPILSSLTTLSSTIASTLTKLNTTITTLNVDLASQVSSITNTLNATYPKLSKAADELFTTITASPSAEYVVQITMFSIAGCFIICTFLFLVELFDSLCCASSSFLSCLIVCTFIVVGVLLGVVCIAIGALSCLIGDVGKWFYGGEFASMLTSSDIQNGNTTNNGLGAAVQKWFGEMWIKDESEALFAEQQYNRKGNQQTDISSSFRSSLKSTAFFSFFGLNSDSSEMSFTSHMLFNPSAFRSAVKGYFSTKYASQNPLNSSFTALFESFRSEANRLTSTDPLVNPLLLDGDVSLSTKRRAEEKEFIASVIEPQIVNASKSISLSFSVASFGASFFALFDPILLKLAGLMGTIFIISAAIMICSVPSLLLMMNGRTHWVAWEEGRRGGKKPTVTITSAVIVTENQRTNEETSRSIEMVSEEQTNKNSRNEENYKKKRLRTVKIITADDSGNVKAMKRTNTKRCLSAAPNLESVERSSSVNTTPRNNTFDIDFPVSDSENDTSTSSDDISSDSSDDESSSDSNECFKRISAPPSIRSPEPSISPNILQQQQSQRQLMRNFTHSQISQIAELQQQLMRQQSAASLSNMRQLTNQMSEAERQNQINQLQRQASILMMSSYPITSPLSTVSSFNTSSSLAAMPPAIFSSSQQTQNQSAPSSARTSAILNRSVTSASLIPTPQSLESSVSIHSLNSQGRSQVNSLNASANMRSGRLSAPSSSRSFVPSVAINPPSSLSPIPQSISTASLHVVNQASSVVSPLSTPQNSQPQTESAEQSSSIQSSRDNSLPPASPRAPRIPTPTYLPIFPVVTAQKSSSSTTPSPSVTPAQSPKHPAAFQNLKLLAPPLHPTPTRPQPLSPRVLPPQFVFNTSSFGVVPQYNPKGTASLPNSPRDNVSYCISAYDSSPIKENDEYNSGRQDDMEEQSNKKDIGDFSKRAPSAPSFPTGCSAQPQLLRPPLQRSRTNVHISLQNQNHLQPHSSFPLLPPCGSSHALPQNAAPALPISPVPSISPSVMQYLSANPSQGLFSSVSYLTSPFVTPPISPRDAVASSLTPTSPPRHSSSFQPDY